MLSAIYGYIKKNGVVVTNYRSIQSYGQAIKALVSSAYRPDSRGLTETFEEAVTRLNLTQSDLDTRRRQLDVQAKLALAIIMTIAAIAAYLALNLTKSAEIINAVSVLLSASIPSSLFIKNSFRVWQIRERRLGGLSEFIRSPGEWLKS